jgi:hypothetical protein
MSGCTSKGLELNMGLKLFRTTHVNPVFDFSQVRRTHWPIKADGQAKAW